MVTSSTTTTAMSTIPTDEKKSPYTWLTTGAYGVNSNGDVEEDNNVRYYSYGKKLGIPYFRYT